MVLIFLSPNRRAMAPPLSIKMHACINYWLQNTITLLQDHLVPTARTPPFPRRGLFPLDHHRPARGAVTAHWSPGAQIVGQVVTISRDPAGPGGRVVAGPPPEPAQSGAAGRRRTSRSALESGGRRRDGRLDRSGTRRAVSREWESDWW